MDGMLNQMKTKLLVMCLPSLNQIIKTVRTLELHYKLQMYICLEQVELLALKQCYFLRTFHWTIHIHMFSPPYHIADNSLKNKMQIDHVSILSTT